MTNQHTPGLWEATGRQIFAESHNHGASQIAIVQDLVEGAANARLIAAAPELLEALEEAYGELCGLECDGPRALLKTRIEAALNKAKGA